MLARMYFHFASFNGTNTSCVVTDVTVEKTGDRADIAQIQTHNIYTTVTGNRTDVMKELTLAHFKANLKKY